MSFEDETIKGVAASKRLTITRSEFLGDWFMSHSPRNGNGNAEGQWGQWVELALSILKHPATELCRPEVHTAVKKFLVNDFYTETSHDLTDEEIKRLFGGAR
jgi:hypothetical protein